ACISLNFDHYVDSCPWRVCRCDGDVRGSSVHIVPLHERWDMEDACAELLNTQWQRSMGARLHSLRQSSANYPVCLLLLEGERRVPNEKLIGHARISRVLGSRSLFVESVVVQSELRGRGYGRILMEGVERYARARGCSRLCLTTHDKQHFYAHLGFVQSRPVQNVGTLASLVPLELLHKFCHMAESDAEKSGGSADTGRHTPPPLSNAPRVPPPPPPLLPPTLEHTPYTDIRGLPVFWMHKDI
uniref:N-acetyltransferase domain-containing protein n=1 Tax=Electrophorus electricus TaxID=8005 RepID=A0A4W4DM99_ELEEL